MRRPPRPAKRATDREVGVVAAVLVTGSERRPSESDRRALDVGGHRPQREMAQLDTEEQAAREPVEAERLSSGEVVDYLRSLPSLWTDAGRAPTSWGSNGWSTT